MPPLVRAAVVGGVVTGKHRGAALVLALAIKGELLEALTGDQAPVGLAARLWNLMMACKHYRPPPLRTLLP